MRFSEMVFRSLWARMESMTWIYCSRVSGGTVKEAKKAGQHEIQQIIVRRHGASQAYATSCPSIWSPSLSKSKQLHWHQCEDAPNIPRKQALQRAQKYPNNQIRAAKRYGDHWVYRWALRTGGA